MVDPTPSLQTTEQVVNIMINPLANVLNQLLALLAAKEIITKEEAIGCIASAAGALDDDRIDDTDGEVGRDMLMRMIKAIDGFVEPARPLAAHLG